MIGWIVGSVCLLGSFVILRRRHFFRFAGCDGYHWGHHHGRGPLHHHRPSWSCGHGALHHDRHGDHHDAHGRHPHRRWRRNPLHFLFAELDTTPGQEKAIMLALDALGESKEAVRRDLSGARRELAELFAADVLDGSALDELVQRQRDHFARVAQLLRDFVAMVHEALTPEQRRALARMVADGSLAAVFDVRGERWPKPVQ